MDAMTGKRPAMNVGSSRSTTCSRANSRRFSIRRAGSTIEDAWHGGCRVRRKPSATSSSRPGGTISGPTMMALADFAMYVAVLASIGPVPLAVTTNLNINFLRKPAQRDLIAECRLLKLGKRLAVGEVTILSRRRGRDGRACHLDLFDPAAESDELSCGIIIPIFISY